MLLAGLVVEVVIPFSSQSLTERLFSSSTSAPPYSPLYSVDTTLDLLEYAKWRHVGRRREHTLAPRQGKRRQWQKAPPPAQTCMLLLFRHRRQSSSSPPPSFTVSADTRLCRRQCSVRERKGKTSIFSSTHFVHCSFLLCRPFGRDTDSGGLQQTGRESQCVADQHSTDSSICRHFS